MDKLLLVFLGGGIGSVLRYVLQLWLNSSGADRPAWSWGTLAANVAGCAVAGALAGLASTRLALNEHARLLLAVGILGGFTTFSAFAAELVTLADHAWTRAATYGLITNAAAIAAAWAAFTLARAATR